MGDIGEAKAALEFIKAGFDVYAPLTESVKADFIVDTGTSILKVQVKTTKSKASSGFYTVQLRTTGKNSNTVSIRKRQAGDYDFLFVLTNDNDWFFIPESELPTNTKTLNNSVDRYKNNFDAV